MHILITLHMFAETGASSFIRVDVARLPDVVLKLLQHDVQRFTVAYYMTDAHLGRLRCGIDFNGDEYMIRDDKGALGPLPRNKVAFRISGDLHSTASNIVEMVDVLMRKKPPQNTTIIIRTPVRHIAALDAIRRSELFVKEQKRAAFPRLHRHLPVEIIRKVYRFVDDQIT